MNNTTTIRVSKETYDTIKLLAEQQHENIQDIVEQAVLDYKKKKFFADLNSAYLKLKENPAAWKEELRERKEWDAILNDGVTNNHD
jgi:predicted transcriptional regulator